MGGCVAVARSRGRGVCLNPEPAYALPSSRLVLVYAMCASVCGGKRMAYVRETHGAVGPGPGPCGHSYGLVYLVGTSKPRYLEYITARSG